MREPAAMDEREGGARMELVVNQRPSLRLVMLISVSVFPVLSWKLMVPVLLRSP